MEEQTTPEQRQAWKEGFADGFALALGLVGSDLNDEPVEGYTLSDYGNDYLAYAKHIDEHDCATCENPVTDECGAVVTCVFCPFCPPDDEDAVVEKT